MSHDHRKVWRALRTTSVGDAFGEAVLRSCHSVQQIARRQRPAGPWCYTSGTVQAAVVVQHLHTHRTVDPDHLAAELARAYLNDPKRKYGANTRNLLLGMGDGRCWRQLSSESFAGFGSMGAGAATRATPLGVYFAHDLGLVEEAARVSARVTHSNNNGVEGAVAVALTAAHFARNETHIHGVWDSLLSRMKPSFTRKRIFRASRLSPGASVEEAVAELGNGHWQCAHDTVPFAIWSALRPSRGYSDTLWTTASGRGSMHTICAIVGGILGAGNRRPPDEWLRMVEPMPEAFLPSLTEQPSTQYRRTSSSR